MWYANLIVALIGFGYLSHLLRGERWVESFISPAPIKRPTAVSTCADADPCDLH
jgi:hypothetical protein